VAYEGIAGHRPFTGATAVDIAAAQVNDPVPPLPDSTEPELARFVMSMLEKDPMRRPQNALDVSRRLSRIERDILDAETGSFPAQKAVDRSSGRSQGHPQARPGTPVIARGEQSGPHGTRGVHISAEPPEPREPRSIRSSPHKMKYHIHTSLNTSHAHIDNPLEDSRDDRKRGSR
jgi:serine/threonine protein kinase